VVTMCFLSELEKQETGEDQLKKITEFSDMVSDAVDVIYRKVALIIVHMYKCCIFYCLIQITKLYICTITTGFER
jgi:uncharacterized membrane protein